MAKKIFSENDFDKIISIGDILVFDKPDLKKLRIDLVWNGTDLDLCAFMLGKDGYIHGQDDAVYYNSKHRWKTERNFTDPDFDPLKGHVSTLEEDCKKYKSPRKWMDATLPLSLDDSVIGSWDDMSDNDDCGETMHVLLEEVDVRKYSSIVLAAVVAKDKIAKGETFADAHDPVVAIYDAEKNELIANYELAQKFPGMDAVCFGKIEYDEHAMIWSFSPMEEAYKGGLSYLAREIFDR